jgi:hypothetical protein
VRGSNQIDALPKLAMTRLISLRLELSLCLWRQRPIARVVPRYLPVLMLMLMLMLTACGAARPAAAGPESPVPSVATSPAARTQVGHLSPTGSASAQPTLPSRSGEAPPPALAQHPPEIVLDPRQPVRSLPELKVENIGLHIGGGPNDAETKAPFLKAVAERFPSFMDCYRQNEDPAQGGRFGIDLHLGRLGGHARLEQPRTALRGTEFRACLSRVFAAVEFQKPQRGPTTLSYSLRFLLVEPP